MRRSGTSSERLHASPASWRPAAAAPAVGLALGQAEQRFGAESTIAGRRLRRVRRARFVKDRELL
jgi:hypothetical protein